MHQKAPGEDRGTGAGLEPSKHTRLSSGHTHRHTDSWPDPAVPRSLNVTQVHCRAATDRGAPHPLRPPRLLAACARPNKTCPLTEPEPRPPGVGGGTGFSQAVAGMLQCQAAPARFTCRARDPPPLHWEYLPKPGEQLQGAREGLSGLIPSVQEKGRSLPAGGQRGR